MDKTSRAASSISAGRFNSVSIDTRLRMYYPRRKPRVDTIFSFLHLAEDDTGV